MAENIQLPPLFEDIGFAPKQYGQAWLLEACVGYAEKPLGESFDFQRLLPHFAGMSAEDLAKYDVTAFYSRRRPGLSDEETNRLIQSDVWAFAAAIETQRLDFYIRGDVIENVDTGEGPYGLSFLPNVVSACGWLSLNDAKAGSAHGFHQSAVNGAPQWFERAALVKLKPEVVKEAGGRAVSLVLSPEHVRHWDFR